MKGARVSKQSWIRAKPMVNLIYSWAFVPSKTVILVEKLLSFPILIMS